MYLSLIKYAQVINSYYLEKQICPLRISNHLGDNHINIKIKIQLCFLWVECYRDSMLSFKDIHIGHGKKN